MFVLFGDFVLSSLNDCLVALSVLICRAKFAQPGVVQTGVTKIQRHDDIGNKTQNQRVQLC